MADGLQLTACFFKALTRPSHSDACDMPVTGWLDPKGPAAGGPPPPSQLSREAHAGFAHVATMLKGQGIVDPAGDQHLTSVLVEFFEARMVRPGLMHCMQIRGLYISPQPAHASGRV